MVLYAKFSNFVVIVWAFVIRLFVTLFSCTNLVTARHSNLNVNNILRLLRNQIIPEIEPLNTQDIWFQMDGAPAHSCRIVTNY